MSSILLPCPFAGLVPHAPPLRIEGTLLRSESGSDRGLICEALAAAPINGPFVDRERLMPEFCIELLAQSAAAGQGFLARLEQREEGGGMLAALDRFSWHRRVEPGDILRVRAQTELTFGPVLVLTGSISRGDDLLAEGRLKIRHGNDMLPAPAAPQALFPADAASSLLDYLRTKALRGIRQQDNGEIVSGTFHFSADFAGFQGHFPGRPILPAIVQCAAVRVLLEQVLAGELLPSEMAGLKWQRPILPDETVVIEAVLAGQDDLPAVTFTLAGPGGRCSSGTALLLRNG